MNGGWLSLVQLPGLMVGVAVEAGSVYECSAAAWAQTDGGGDAGLHNVRVVGGGLQLQGLSRHFGACGELQSLQSLPASAPSAHRCHALNRTLCEAVVTPSRLTAMAATPEYFYRCAPTVMTLVSST